MFLIHLQGVFARLSYWDSREQKRAGIGKDKAKGVYLSQARRRGSEGADDFLYKPRSARR